jgi:hypothetical protein
MKTKNELTTTTTGTLSSQMILNHCGNYAGEFQDNAFEIFQELWDSELNSLDMNQWMDIMYNKEGKVFAIFAEDALTCQNAWCFYVELQEEDCPEAFKIMKEKLM